MAMNIDERYCDENANPDFGVGVDLLMESARINE